MGRILDLFTPKIGFWGVIIALVVGAVGIGVQQIRLSDVRSDLKDTRAAQLLCVEDRATLRVNQATLEAALASQKLAIEALEAEKRRRAALAAEAARKALESTEKAKADAGRLGSGPAVMNAWQKELYQ